MWRLAWPWSSHVSSKCPIDWALTSLPLRCRFSNSVGSDTSDEVIPVSALCSGRQTTRCVHRYPCCRPSIEFCRGHIHRMPIQRLQKKCDSGLSCGQFSNFDSISILTVIGWIVVHRARQLYWLQIWHNFVGAPLVQALPQRQHVHLFELLEQSGRRLMDCTDYGASLTR